MKILYSADDRPGAGIQLQRFLEHNDTHTIRVAAYMSARRFLPGIDWTLNALKTKNPFRKNQVNELFGYTGLPFVDPDAIEYLLDDIVEWEPDLIISDGEKISAHAASVLDIPLWFCSPLHLLDGVLWDFTQAPYKAALHKTSQQLKALPPADRYLVYSPFGDIPMRPMLKDDFEWVTPYTKEPKKFQCSDNQRLKQEGFQIFKQRLDGFFCAGETSFLSDAIYAGHPVYVSPSADDPESMINALFCQQYGLGVDLGDVGNGRYASRCLANLPIVPSVALSRQGYPKLHQLLEE
jgi:hypothetical protein